MNPGDERGFTLLETLVALSIVSLLSVALLGVFSFGETVLRRAKTDSDSERQLLLAQDTLANALAELPAFPGQMISGSIDQLSFQGFPPRTSGVSALTRTVLRFDRPRERLIAIWETGRRSDRPIQHDLLTASAARFSFFSSKSGWSTAWQSAEPPSLIRIELTELSGKLRDLRFSPRSVNERGCRQQGSCKRL